MINLKIFIVAYDRILNRVFENISQPEIDVCVGYTVQKKVEKNITTLVKNVVNEWELPWNNYEFQTKQYYDYSSFFHIAKNPHLYENLSHIGILQYDVIFGKNSINDVLMRYETNPDIIFYQKIRYKSDLYLTKYELENICSFMSSKLNISISHNNIWDNGWVSETLSVVPIDVFLTFSNFMLEYQVEIEDILTQNKWGIMNNINHRLCGIAERMWGIYLCSLGKPLEKLNIIHDRDFYFHKHESESNWIKI